MGMLRVVFNIKAGNDYSTCKSTFIMTLIKQEKLVFILVILYIREYLYVFTNCLQTCTRISEDFQFRISGSQNNWKSTAVFQNRRRVAGFWIKIICTISRSVTLLLKQQNVTQLGGREVNACTSTRVSRRSWVRIPPPSRLWSFFTDTRKALSMQCYTHVGVGQRLNQ